MEQRRRQAQQEKQQPQTVEMRAGEGPEKSERHEFKGRKGWHAKPLPDGGEMIISDGF